MQINWPLVGMVLKTGVAEGKEIDMQGLLLAMRVIPVTNRPDTAAAIVILQDITELKKKDTELLIKSVVIREIHHRVKNNLQTIVTVLTGLPVSLLYMNFFHSRIAVKLM